MLLLMLLMAAALLTLLMLSDGATAPTPIPRDPAVVTMHHHYDATALVPPPQAAVPGVARPSSMRLEIEGAIDVDGDIDILRRDFFLKHAVNVAGGDTGSTEVMWRAAAASGCSGELNRRTGPALLGSLHCGAVHVEIPATDERANQTLQRGTVGWTMSAEGRPSFFILVQATSALCPAALVSRLAHIADTCLAATVEQVR